jgi:hypothetical protein
LFWYWILMHWDRRFPNRAFCSIRFSQPNRNLARELLPHVADHAAVSTGGSDQHPLGQERDAPANGWISGKMDKQSLILCFLFIRYFFACAARSLPVSRLAGRFVELVESPFIRKLGA